MEKGSKGNCFVIMPISDPEGYKKGHFEHVYKDIFSAAIIEAGYTPKRADDENSSTMIQVNIIKDIIEAPMAICDLSSRNPNVLFELGIRQAFDLPVVLVQEEGTPRIFDISTINTIDYRKEMIYHEVIEDREKILKAISATSNSSQGVNSIVKLLEIGKKAEISDDKLTEDDEIKLLLYSISNQVENMDKRIARMEKADNYYMEDLVDRILVPNREAKKKANNSASDKLLALKELKKDAHIRVYEIAKMLNMSNLEVLEILNSNGMTMPSHISDVPKEGIDILINYFKKASE